MPRPRTQQSAKCTAGWRWQSTARQNPPVAQQAHGADRVHGADLGASRLGLTQAGTPTQARCAGGCDQTGMGEAVVEQAQARHGREYAFFPFMGPRGLVPLRGVGRRPTNPWRKQEVGNGAVPHKSLVKTRGGVALAKHRPPKPARGRPSARGRPGASRVGLTQARRAGTQWQAGENTVAESLSEETLAALAADPNFTVSAGEMKKEGRAEKGKGKAKKKTTPKEKGIAAKPAAKPTPEQEVAPTALCCPPQRWLQP